MVMTRTIPARELAASPLILVLAQVRFSQILSMDTHVPAIQDRLRKLGYVRYQPSTMTELHLDADAMTLRKDQRPRWDFLDRDRRNGVVLADSFVVLHTNQYSTYEAFLPNFIDVLKVLHEIAQPALTVRVGLRYVDVIRPRKGEEIKDYLNAGLLAFDLGTSLPTDMIQRTSSRVESVAETKTGTLSVRSTVRSDGQYLPPDLAPPVLTYDDYIAPSPGETIGVLDIDHASILEFDFDVERLESVLIDLHDAAGLAFRAAATPFARTAWGTLENKQWQ